MNLKNISFNDFRFWLMLFFIIRLWGIQDPPLEISHSWRQSLTSMMTRNLAKNDFQVLSPEIDSAGEKSGVIGSEFPAFNIIPAGFSRFFGFQHGYGRLLNLIVTTLGIWAFYKIICEMESPKAAFFSGMMLLFSCWFAFSRKNMPDTFSASLVIIGLYFFLNWKTHPKRIFALILGCIFASLGMLSKMPSAVLLTPIALFLFQEFREHRIDLIFISAIVISILPALIWYFFWVPEIIRTHGYELYFPRTFFTGLTELVEMWPKTIEKFYFSALSSYLAFLIFLAGFISLLIKKEVNRLGLFALVCIPFFFFMIKAGNVFSLHNYYIIPFVPLMAWVAGKFLAHVNKRLGYILLILAAGESIANQQHDFFIKPNQWYKTSLEKICKDYIPKKSRIITAGGNSPQLLFFCNRKGWALEPEELNNTQPINKLRTLGAEFLIFDKHHGNRDCQGKIIFQNEDFVVFDIRNTRTE